MNLPFYSRSINNSMSNYITDTIKKLMPPALNGLKTKVGILGYTYKENSDDIRYSKTDDIIQDLVNSGYEVEVSDYLIEDKKLSFSLIKQIKDVDVLIVTVAHDRYKDYNVNDILKFYKKNSSQKILLDLKSIYRDLSFPSDIVYWEL